MKSDLKLFPGPFIYIEEIKNHSNIKRYLLPFIEKEKNQKIKNYTCSSHFGTEVITSYFDNYQKKSQDDFFHYINNSGYLKDIIWNPLDNCLFKLPYQCDYKAKQSIVNGLWFNYFEKGGSHAVHDHIGSFISGIYIVHLEEENPTVFLGSNNNIDFYSFTYETKNVKEGSVILFPSQMYHFVNPVKTKRVTISFNINTSFE